MSAFSSFPKNERTYSYKYPLPLHGYHHSDYDLLKWSDRQFLRKGEILAWDYGGLSTVGPNESRNLRAAFLPVNVALEGPRGASCLL